PDRAGPRRARGPQGAVASRLRGSVPRARMGG
ncbi:hypothetical protein GA0115247_11001, partial [Streptomyces sp. PalvLS-984]